MTGTTFADWVAGGSHLDWRGNRIFHRIDGDGAPLVLIHGFPTSSHDWAGVVVSLKGRFRILTFDLLGYGASDKPRGGDYSSFRQTDFAVDLIERLGFADAAIVGHDLGGIVLQQLLARRAANTLPFAPATAVFMNSSVYAELYRPSPRQRAMAHPVTGPILARYMNRDKLAAGLAPLFPSRRPTAEEFDDIWAALSRDGGHRLVPRHLVYMRERERHHREWEAAMEAADVPLGFVWGMADPVSGAPVLREARRRLPRARFAELDGVGHFPPVEAPERTAARIAEVLR